MLHRVAQRTSELSHGKFLFDKKNEIATSPKYPIRGHQSRSLLLMFLTPQELPVNNLRFKPEEQKQLPDINSAGVAQGREQGNPQRVLGCFYALPPVKRHTLTVKSFHRGLFMVNSFRVN